jgi:hypothetical protein
MSERLETLNKARARMIEDRDVHAKVLAAPFDRDKAERAQQIYRDAGAHRRTGSRHKRRASRFAEKLNRGGGGPAQRALAPAVCSCKSRDLALRGHDWR